MFRNGIEKRSDHAVRNKHTFKKETYQYSSNNNDNNNMTSDENLIESLSSNEDEEENEIQKI